MPKKIDFVKRAWNAVGFEVPVQYDTQEKINNGISEIKLLQQSLFNQLEELKERIVELKDGIDKSKNLLGDLENINHQIKVQKSKELNKDLDCEIF